MARSTYIYVIVLGEAMAPFTVKHEAKAWLEKKCPPSWVDQAVVKKFADNAGGLRKVMPAREFLES
jgi:hypothetical protein